MDTSVINWEHSLKQVGGKAQLAEELIAMFVAELPISRKSILSAYQAKHYQALKDELHKLGGGCAYAGVPRLKKIINELSAALNTSQNDHLDKLVDALNKEVDAILQVAATQSYLPKKK